MTKVERYGKMYAGGMTVECIVAETGDNKRAVIAAIDGWLAQGWKRNAVAKEEARKTKPRRTQTGPTVTEISRVLGYGWQSKVMKLQQ